MYGLLHSVFRDRSDGLLFKCFGLWHIAYILAFVLLFVFALLKLKGRDEAKKTSATKRFCDISFYIMLADFFFMPLAYGEIDVEKLPFHICTAMCVMSFLSYRVEKLKKYRINFATLGLISNFGYLLYPAGVMWHQTHPVSYRVIETLSFHGFMTVFGLLVLVFEADRNCIKRCYRDFVTVACMVAWALIGNCAYNGFYSGKEHFYNWFFVVRDPFYIIPESASRFVMPIFNILTFFLLEIVIYTVIYKAKREK